jgi:ketosteroid isomerase-like protein
MDERLVDRLRRAYDVFNVEGVEGILDLLDPAVVWVSRDGDSYAGHDGARRWYAHARASFDEIRFAQDALIDAGEGRILAELTVHVRAAGSGVRLERQVAHLWTFGDAGLVMRLEMYADLDKGRAAAGLA